MLEATGTAHITVWQPRIARNNSTHRDVRSRAEKKTPGVRPSNVLATILIVAIVASLSMLSVFLLLHFREPMAGLGSWGYLGGFVAEFTNSAVIIIPTPAPAYTFTMGITLNPMLLGLIGGIGAATGELTGYILGARGRGVLQRGRLYERLTALSAQRTGPFLLASAMLPLPFDVAGVWAGAIRYPVWRFLILVTIGKVVKVTAIALAGYYGLNWFLGPLG